jgi:hypothetical protein
MSLTRLQAMSLTRRGSGWHLSCAGIVAISGAAWSCAGTAPKGTVPQARPVTSAPLTVVLPEVQPEAKDAPDKGPPSARPPGVALGTVLDGRPLSLSFEKKICKVGPDSPLDFTEVSRKLQVNLGGPKPQTFSVEADGVPTICSSELAVPLEKGDFNFDGAEDFAVPLDQTGPYGSVTYRVFIFDKAATQYVEAPGLSVLTQQFMGIFAVDAKRKLLQVASKSGCCIHYSSEFAVDGLKPVLHSSRTLTHDPESGRCTVATETVNPDGVHQTTDRYCTAEEKGP